MKTNNILNKKKKTMIIFERETKTLIIPEGLGTESGDGGYNEGFEAGKTAQKAIDDAKITPTTTITENGSYEAPYGFKEVVVNVGECDCTDEVDAAYQKGYTAGDNAGFGRGLTSGENLQKAKLTSTTITANGTYTREDGWNSIEVAVPQEGDCTEAYNQGYSDGIGETASVYIQIKAFYPTLTLINREVDVNGDSFHYTGAKGYELLPGNNLIILAYEGKLPDKYITPTSVSFTILTNDIEAWNGGGDNWYIDEVKFNGLVDSLHSSYTGGFKVGLGNWTVTQVDSTTSKITINLN